MSLGKIGKLTNVFNAFKQSPFSNKSDMISSLAAFGNINKAASYLNKVNSDGAISNTASKMLLYKAYAASGITKEEAGEALNNNLAGSSKFGLLGNIKNVGSGIATVFKSIAPMMIPLIIGAVGIKAGKMLWDNVLTDNAAQKNLQESVQKYKTEKSDLDNLQSQKETNKQRVYELRAKSNRTAAEDNELNNLLNEDSILDTQIGLKKRTVTSAQKQQALDAKKALEKRTFQGELFGKSPYPVYQDTNIGYAQKLMNGLEDEKQAREDVLNNKEWSSERKEAELKAKDKTIASYETELADVMSDISSNAQDLYDEDGNLIDKKNTQDLANNINDLFKAYSMLTNSSDYVSDKMDNIFALSKFSNLKDKLIEAGKSGGTDAIKDLISQTKDLNEAMSNAGIDADDLADGIMAIADPDAKNLEGIKDNLKDIFGKKYSFFKDKNDEDIEGFWDYLQDNNLNPEKMKWGKKDISDNWEDYLNFKKSTEIVDDTTFASRFKNSAEDTATDLDTITDNFQTDMSNIKSSMDSIKSGTFQNSDITDLIQQFPELATETDNLQQGLQNLAFDKASNAIGKIRDSVKDVTDPKELAAADKYVQSIMDTMDLSGFDMSNAKSAILGNLTKNLADKHMASVTTSNLVNQLMSEYGNDEIAVQAIMKLSLDPSMANADIETWKAKIEDTKVQIQLDTSAKNLDNLSKDLTRLQTDATNQQTKMSNKAVYNLKENASDYQDLIDNGDAQIENLNNQIEEYQNSIDALKNSKGLSSLTKEESEQIKTWQDGIESANMSIENMRASQQGWKNDIKNLPITNITNLTSAISSALSEIQTNTGLTTDTMDNLRTQFSDLAGADVDSLFTRTAKGLELDTDKLKSYLDQQNKFQDSRFVDAIEKQKDAVKSAREAFEGGTGSQSAWDSEIAKLNELQNMRAQYYAQYAESEKQFSAYQKMVNGQSAANEGDEYTQFQQYLKNAKDLYDKDLVGTEAFKTTAAYLSQNGFDDADNFIENYNRLSKYFTEDSSGPQKFLSDLQSKGLATYGALEDGNYSWQMSFTDVQDAADQMGMSLESFQAIIGRLGDYGFINNYVSSLAEGESKVDEIEDKLVDAQGKYAEMKAKGASQSVLDDQQAVIDGLQSQLGNMNQAISDYTNNESQRQANDLKAAKEQIAAYNDELEKVGKDSDLGQKYIKAIQDTAKENHIELTADFKVDEDSYQKTLAEYENEAKNAEIKHYQEVNAGIESGNTGDYTDSDVELVNKIKEAQDKKSENYQQLQELINTLNQQEPSDLDQIKLGNGAYESEDQGIRAAEDSMQSFANQLGLTQEQANALLTVLRALGEIKIDPEVKDKDKGLEEQVKTYSDVYDQLQEEQGKIEDWGLSSYGNAYDTSGNSFVQKQFGNVDMDKRQIITWSDELKKTYSQELSSWDYNPENGGIDTVFGGSDRFAEGTKGLKEGVEVAFTPIMNTADGKTTFLGKDTVYDYIDELIGEATSDGNFSEDKLLSLDKKGRKIGDQFVQGILAAADTSTNYDNNGNKAELYGKMMHFSGDYGALGLAYSELGENADTVVSTMGKVSEALDSNDESVQNSIDTIKQYTASELDGINLFDGKYDSKELEPAEQALDNLVESFKLTDDEAAQLAKVLAAMGVTKPEVDDSEVKQAGETAQETSNSISHLKELQYSGAISSDVDLDFDSAEMSADELQSKIDELNGMKAEINAEVNPEAAQELDNLIAKTEVQHTMQVAIEENGESVSDLLTLAQENEEEFKIKFNLDDAGYQQALSYLQDKDMEITIKAHLDDTTSIDDLLTMGDDELQKTLEIDSSQVDDAKAKLQEMKAEAENMDITVKIDETQFGELTKSINTDTVDLTVDVHDDQLSALESRLDSITSKEKKVTVNADAPDTSQITALSTAISQVLPRTVGVRANVKGTDDVNDLSDAIAKVLPRTVRVVAETSGQTAVENLASAISQVQSKSVTITATTNNITNNITKAVKLYTGTALSPAHVSGTAYNVLNTIPMSSAFANGGKVGLSEDQKALVNELGTESVIRGDKWFLLPGGMHTENLKKGDIVLNHKQTADLIKGGKAFGHARAYANGNLDDLSVLSHAYANAGNTTGNFNSQKHNSTPSSGSGNSGNAALTKAINNNTDATKDSSDTTSSSADKVDEALENAIKKLKDNAMDWIEVAMDRLDRITSKYTDYAESDYSHYTRSQKYYDKAIASTDKEIKAAKEGAARYKAQAEKVAADSEVSKYLTAALKKKVQDGTIDVESLSANQKAAVEAYKEYYDKYLDATKTYMEKKVQRLDLAKAKVDNVYDSYDVIVGKREAAENYWNAKAENRVAHGKNQKVGSIYYKDLQKQVTYAKSQKSLMSSEEKKVRKRMAEYLKVNGRNVKDKAYQEMKKQLIELQTSEIEMDTHIQELNQTIQDTRENIKQWSVDRWERAGAKQDAIINYKLVTDKADRQIQEKDYTERIKTANREILALDNLRKEKAEYYDMHFSSMNNEEAQKYLEELAQIDEQIMNLASDVEEFKNKIMELRWKPFDDLQNDLSNLITEYQNAQKLLGDSDSFYNDDGSFTTNGLTNILLTQESIDTTKDKIANYRVALDKLDEQYKNGCYSAEEYKAKQQDLLKSLQQESATLADLKQNLLDMYTTQVIKENDLLQENIDKRKEALDAKEKYYDYDKTLKKKTKDINTLKAQIAALEGTSNAASKARLEKLRAELADAEDDMADTMHQHEVDMKNTGYENFSNEANKALDNTLDAVKKNAAFQEAIIGNMLDTVTADYDSTYNHLHDVMDQYGMKVSQVFDANISKVADFNREAGKAADIVNKINTSYVPGTGNTKADTVVKDDLNRNNGSDNAGNEKPGTMGGTTYSLKLNASEIYLTYSHLKYSLKATWSPSKPEHSDIEWKSSDESIAKVSSDGTVRGVSAGLGKNGLMSRDESKTRKCIITANGGPGLATAECIVHIMPDSHYEAIKGYAERAGKLETSGNNLRDSMEYAYKNGAFRSNQSSTAVEGFQKAYLKDWFNALPDRPNGATDVPSGISQLAGYFYSKGKQVTRNDMQKLADILEIKTPGVGSYDTWGGTLKNKILKAYKAYGFSKGGVVRNGIPASILDMIGGDALIPRGDSVLIGANPGETVLTKEFTDQLKPTVATLNAFNEMMAKPLTPILPSSNGDTNVNSECNITINVDSINNEQDIKKLAYQIGDIITERNKRDWKKVR